MDRNVSTRLLPKIMIMDQKEFFFARAVLLVEGDTEVGAMPILSKRLGKEFDKYGITIWDIGNNDFTDFAILLQSLRIPYLVMCDKDTLSDILSLPAEFNKKPIQTSSVIKQISRLKPQLEEDEIKQIEDSEKEIELVSNDNTYRYNKTAIARLMPLANKRNFMILTSDFEGILNKDNNTLLECAHQAFPRGKMLQGRQIAQNLKTVHTELQNIIEKIISLGNINKTDT